jgi:hypothetical protein
VMRPWRPWRPCYGLLVLGYLYLWLGRVVLRIQHLQAAGVSFM